MNRIIRLISFSGENKSYLSTHQPHLPPTFSRPFFINDITFLVKASATVLYKRKHVEVDCRPTV